MAMRQVSVVRRGILVTMVLAAWIAPAGAQESGTNGHLGPEIQVRRLGTTARFSGPMRSVDDLRSMVNTNRDQISRVLTMAGLGNISAQVLDALTTGHMTDAAITPGTHMEWMAEKRSGTTPALLRNVRWAGQQPFDAWQFSVDAGGFTYTFVVPKVCGNLSLVTTVANRVAEAPRVEPPPPPPPPPVVSPPPVAAAPPPPPPPPPPAPAPAPAEPSRNPWTASGFAGTSFGTSGDVAGEDDINSSMTFGGQVSYAWRRYIGGEFIADFAPTYKIANVAFAEHPRVNSYMANVIGMFPLADGRFEPYVSGGFGGIQMHTTFFTFPAISNGATTTANETRFGSDIGAGVMLFAGHVGVRTDVRRYKASTSDELEALTFNTPADTFTRALLSGLEFWRASVGVAFRW